jgi:exosome complex exonuclease RRP6
MSGDNDDDDLPDLKPLLASLASFARATQALPATEDEFQYERSYPEFQFALQKAQDSLRTLLQTSLREMKSLKIGNGDEILDTDDVAIPDDLDDPVLWEQCADACEYLVEQAERYLHGPSASDEATTNGSAATVQQQLRQFSAVARDAAEQSKFHRIVANTRNDLPKPQDLYKMSCHPNSRIAPFVPAVHPDKPHAVSPLALTLIPGHGFDTRLGELRSSRQPLPPPSSSSSSPVSTMVAPTQHCPHVYEAEIRSFTYTARQLEAPKPPAVDGSGGGKGKLEASSEPLRAKWIDTERDLQELALSLSDCTEFALDLEAHSHRSFGGIVCLMQITVHDDQNYLIDTLKLHDCINKHMAAPLANPAIVKVMHGADSDIPWLQRDFGLYVVNLFDTGRAARALRLASASYAHLLHHYVGIVADKSHQLADWRERPLSATMQQYAIQDTYYLLQMYPYIKYDLDHHRDASIEQVLDFSRQVCLIRYCPEPFYPNGYQKLLTSRGRIKKELNATQTLILKRLWDWRDQTARSQDESVQYVCTNANLLRIAMSSPTSVSQLQGLFNPIPPLVFQSSQDIVDLVKRGLQEEEDDDDDEEDEDDDDIEAEVGTASSAYFKPAASEKENRGGMLSPVLGTEALYKQAGWMTPLDINEVKDEADEEDEAMGLATTTDEDDEDDDAAVGSKPKHFLSVHPSNKNYHSKEYAEHNLKLGEGGHGSNTDGKGSVRASKPNDEVDRDARQSADEIKRMFQRDTIPIVLGLVASKKKDGGNADKNKKQAGVKAQDAGADFEEEFMIPRSIREIYMISNRNRRNKKAGSPTPERGVTPTTEKERDEMARAEALLKSRGDAVASYFDEGPNPTGKRPRTKFGRESEESVPDPSPNVASKEDDLNFMKEIGWIKSDAHAESILNQRYGRGRGDADKKGSNNFSEVSTVAGVMPSQQQPSSNPFFAGAAMEGGPLAQSAFAKPETKRKGGAGKGKSNRGGRQYERPEKKDGRSHAYRKR